MTKKTGARLCRRVHSASTEGQSLVPAPTWGSSQPPVIPASRICCPLLASIGKCTYVHIFPQIYTNMHNLKIMARDKCKDLAPRRLNDALILSRTTADNLFVQNSESIGGTRTQDLNSAWKIMKLVRGQWYSVKTREETL